MEDAIVPTIEVTRTESQFLFHERLRALEDACRRDAGGVPVPVRWRKNWRANLELLGRNRDGTLKARIVCRKGNTRQRYVRSLRGPVRRPWHGALDISLTLK
jgi:hypothetical protein